MAIKLLLGLAIGAVVRIAPLGPFLRNPRGSPVVADAMAGMDMKPAPINPDWILAGEPVARCAEHSRTADDLSYTAMWDCTAGTFHWHFHWDETVAIVEGEVHITAEDGTQRLLRTGDIALFRAGTSATWRVDDYVRKIAFLRRPFPGPLAGLLRLRNRFRRVPQASL